MLFLLFHLRFKENSVLLADFDSLWNMSQSEKKTKTESNSTKQRAVKSSAVACTCVRSQGSCSGFRNGIFKKYSKGLDRQVFVSLLF